MVRIVKIVATISLVMVLFSSCSNQLEQERERVVLKVSGITQEVFDARYGNPIEFHQYVVHVETLPNQAPDIILTNSMELPALVREEQLMQIDPLVDMSQEHMTGIAPTIMEKLRIDGGDGYQYGLPITFSSDVLYYNKDLFEQYETPYPTHGMSWSEVFDLEQALLKSMVEKGQAAYGLLESRVEEAAIRIDSRIIEYALSEGIPVLDSTNRRMQLDTGEWRRLWLEIITAHHNYRSITEINRPVFPYESSELSFSSGRAPLMLGGDYHYHNWQSADVLSFEMGIVTPPGSHNIYYQNSVVAIAAETVNSEAAWELVKHMTSEESTERILTFEEDGSFPPKGYSGQFPARIKLLEDKDKVDLSGFYLQEPASEGIYSVTNSGIPDEFYIAFRESRISYIQAVLDGKLTIDEAIVQLQHEAQSLLDR